MKSHARILGHPIHQMIVPIPMGLFLVGSVLDIVQRFVDAPWIPALSFWNLTIGVVGALLAAGFGAVDLFAIPDGTRAKRIAGLHAIGNLVVVGAFVIALFMRWENRTLAAPTLALGLEVFALLLAGMTAWLGGELVDRLGVGVDDGADLDAPSSLTHDSRDRPRLSAT